MSEIQDVGRVQAVADKLNAMERQLLLGQCTGWGSWMWDAGTFMVALGLGTKAGGDIAFNTPLAEAVISLLRAQQAQPQPESPNNG